MWRRMFGGSGAADAAASTMDVMKPSKRRKSLMARLALVVALPLASPPHEPPVRVGSAKRMLFAASREFAGRNASGAIPNLVHFVFGLGDKPATLKFSQFLEKWQQEAIWHSLVTRRSYCFLGLRRTAAGAHLRFRRRSAQAPCAAWPPCTIEK